MKIKYFLAILLSIAIFTSCTKSPEKIYQKNAFDKTVEDYLFIELSMGLHDKNHVDAYFGPESIQTAAKREKIPLEAIVSNIHAVREQLDSLLDYFEKDPIIRKRIIGLFLRIRALKTRIKLFQGYSIPFDEESKLLFGVQAPTYDSTYFENILNQIDALVPGEGNLSERVNDFRHQFIVPPELLPEVFKAAINECRRRTLEHIDLPRNESFVIEYVKDKPWSGYNWYQGNAKSLIQINTDLPISIDRAIDLGCHEGYPGHHTYNVLKEKNLVKKLHWTEFSLYPLFGHQSLIAEGSANFGIDLAFSKNDRISFEQQTLFPLAELDSAQASQYYNLLELMSELNYAGNEAARSYLNGEKTREEAAAWLVKYSLSSQESAEKRVDFFDTYRSYVINYNLGKDLVKNYIETGTSDQNSKWEKFIDMLSTQILPADLL